MPSETGSSEQTLRDAESKSEGQVVAEPAQTEANMSEEKHSWDRLPAWDGDKRQWKRYLRDVELYLETEKLVVDFCHGARLLSRLTGSARKCAETIELDTIRRSTNENKVTREGMVACVKYLLKALVRAMVMKVATKKGQVQEFFYKKLQTRPGQPMAEWVNVFENAVLDMKSPRAER